MGLFSIERAQEAFLVAMADSFDNASTAPDLVIKVSDQETKCHKIILCRQSEWFKNACEGKFKESTADTIELHDDGEEAVHAMLEYCYTFDYEPHPDRSYAFHVAVFNAAEKYRVQKLADLALDKLVDKVKTMEEEEFLAAIIAIYTAACEPTNALRRTLARIVIESRFGLLKDDQSEFNKLLDTVPAFAGDIVRAMTYHPRSLLPNVLRNDFKEELYDCPRQSCEGRISPDDERQHGGGSVRASSFTLDRQCKRCGRWTSLTYWEWQEWRVAV